MRLTIFAAFASVVLASPLSAADVLRIDLQDTGTSVTASGWVPAHNGLYFNGSGAGTDPGSVTIDIDGNGSTETLRFGYRDFLSGSDRDRGVPGTWTFTQEYKDVLRDFSNPISATNDEFVIWGLPAGKYEAKVWMRDDAFGSGTYQLLGVQDGDDVLFSVVHSAFNVTNPDSASDVDILSTIDYNPPDAFRTWASAPSLVFALNPGSSAPMAGLQITFIPAATAAVPEPLSVTIWSLLGVVSVAAVARRRGRVS